MMIRQFLILKFLPVLIFISASIFSGLKLLIPLVFIIQVFFRRIKWTGLTVLIQCIPVLLILGGLLFLAPVFFNSFSILKSETEGEKELFLTMLTGSQWYKFILPALIYGFLPQLTWYKGFRNIYFALFMFATWISVDYLIQYLSQQNHLIFSEGVKPKALPWSEYMHRGMLFLAITGAIYRMLRRSKINQS